jgi:long-chain acyl-CoA synthetase
MLAATEPLLSDERTLRGDSAFINAQSGRTGPVRCCPGASEERGMVDGVLAERAEIDRAVDGQTLCDLYSRNAAQYGDWPALSWQADDGAWRSTTWREYRELCADVAVGLADLGVEHGDFVAIMAGNRPEHVVADGGALHAAATPVSLYMTLASEQIAHVAGNCGAKVAILENRDVIKRWEDLRGQLPALEHVVLIDDAEDFAHLDWVSSWSDLLARGRRGRAQDPDAFDARWAKVRPEDPATLIYTSGTTGPPKGVTITHRNVRWMLESARRAFPLEMGSTGISYLPLAHVAERMFSHWMGLRNATSVFFVNEISKALEGVQAARPAAFVAVPRVWEKMQAGLLAGIENEPDERRRALAQRAIALGRDKAGRERDGRPVPLATRLQHAVLDKLVLAKIRTRIGLDRCDIALSGAAPISMDVLEFFAALGLPIHEVYGMTETTSATHANTPGHLRMGTVGRPLPGVEVRIAEDGEVCVRGGNVMAGYWDEPEATAETIDGDGWLHTGDLGRVDAEGYLTIVGRKKEILITAGGKNIAPNLIEGYVKEHPLVGQVCVIGDQRRYVAALIVLDAEAAPAWAEKHGVAYADLASFSADERVRAEVQRAVDAANARLNGVEQIKRFTLLPSEWTPETEELTPSMKLKRRVILERYSAEIESLYA